MTEIEFLTLKDNQYIIKKRIYKFYVLCAQSIFKTYVPAMSLSPTSWSGLIPTQISQQLFAEMKSDDDQLPELYPPDPQHHSLFISNLFDQPHTDRPFLFNQCHNFNREEQKPPPPDLQVQENYSFNLHTIEKQDQIRHIPEKMDQEHGEEDPLDFDLLPKKTILSSDSFPKRPSAINKTAYNNESRQQKIERYLQKKHRRVWSRKISYTCRKVVADNRERKNGRFVKKQEGNPGGSSSKQSSKETRQGQVKEECAAFKIQDYYR